jgi:hypothetical protein
MRPDVALIWGLCAGVTPDELVSAAGSLRYSAAVYAGLTGQRCHAVVARLAGSGLVLTG